MKLSIIFNEQIDRIAATLYHDYLNDTFLQASIHSSHFWILSCRIAIADGSIVIAIDARWFG
jgi:hypothetical protein